MLYIKKQFLYLLSKAIIPQLYEDVQHSKISIKKALSVTRAGLFCFKIF